MAVTIKDVAKIAGVAPSTVSRVISDNPRISKATKERVHKVMEKLNYHPNIIARSLANKETKTLGLILPNDDKDLFVNPFFTKIMRGISLYAQKNKYYIIYTYSYNEDEEVQHIKNLINSKWVDGIILSTVRKNDKCIKYLKEINHPFVVIGKPENTEKVCWVDNDNFHSMYSVVDFLIKKGEKQIAFIGGPDDLIVTKERLEGYKKSLLDSGLSIDENIIKETDFTEQCGYNAMKEILNVCRPNAVVTTDDLIAFGVLKLMNELGYKDISVVGFNNTPTALYRTPTLSSVEINAEKLGYYATKLLINQLNNENIELKNYIVDTELVERDSTK